MQNISNWKTVVAALSDDALVSEARRYAQGEREQTAWLVAHMAEIYRRDLSLKRGCGKMVEFACEEFKLSSRQAWYRVAAARLALDVPNTIEKLASGELTLCSAATLFRAIEEAEKAKVTPVAKNDPVAPAFALELPAAPTPTPVKPTLQEKREVAKAKKETKKNEAPQATETLGDAARLQFVNELRLGRVLREVIPAPVKRRVFIRFNGRCQFEDRKTGRKCNSTAFVDVDHIIPIANGGTNEESNLTLACASHNRRRYFWPTADQPLYAAAP